MAHPSAAAAAVAAIVASLSSGVGRASVAEQVAGKAAAWPPPHVLAPNRTASFGSGEASRADAPAGTFMFKVSDQHFGSQLFQAVQWTSSGVTIPASLVLDVCGSLPERQTFSYTINERWPRAFGGTMGVGPQQCNHNHVGWRWDPSAACSGESANQACYVCHSTGGYRCSEETFDPRPDAMGSFAYRFLNQDACELGDLSGMAGELEKFPTADCYDLDERCAELARDGACARHPEHMNVFCQSTCRVCESVVLDTSSYVALGSVTNHSRALAQMSTQFGEIHKRSVTARPVGVDCSASGPPPVHQTNCGCLEFNGRLNPSMGVLSVLRPYDHKAFYMAGPGLEELEGRSVVIRCGSTFGAKAGVPLMCAKLM